MITMLLRDRVEEIVRGLLANPANSQPMPREPIQQPALTTRQDLFAKMSALREEHERDVLPLQVEAASIESRLNEVLAQAAGLRIQLSNVMGQEFVRNLQLSTATDRVMANLLESAPSVIGDFIVEMNQELDRLIRLKPQYTRGVGQLDLVTLVKPKYTFSDAPKIGRRVMAVRSAINRAEQLKVIEMSDAELVAEFESIRANLPSIAGELEPVRE